MSDSHFYTAGADAQNPFAIKFAQALAQATGKTPREIRTDKDREFLAKEITNNLGR